MSLNLHAAVRGQIQAVNADVSGYWYVSKGSVPGPNGKRTPVYQLPAEVPLQVQPPSGRDLRFINLLQLQGVIRSVWMFSNPGGINRVNQLGNDLLMFPQWPGQPLDVWLVARPDETWGVTEGGWSKVYAVLQEDRSYSVSDDNGLLILDDRGAIVRSK